MPTKPARLLICSTCTGARDLPAERARIKATLAAAGVADQVELAQQPCMNACTQPVSLGLQGQGRASYVFAGVAPLEDADDIAATCRTYLEAEAGWIEDARPCGRLRQCLRARLPAVDAPPRR